MRGPLRRGLRAMLRLGEDMSGRNDGGSIARESEAVEMASRGIRNASLMLLM